MCSRYSRRRSTSVLVQVQLAVVCVAATGLMAQSPDKSPPSYSAQFITPGLGAINAAGMNEAGDVVGTGDSGAWVSLAGAPGFPLPLPPGATFAFANDISDTGIIVGSVGPTSSLGFGKAAAWYPDGAGGYKIEEFGTLPGHVHSDATAVNNLGDIVGYSSNGTFRFPVLFTAPGGIQDLSDTGVFDPVDINDQRVLIDHSFTVKRLDLDTMIVEDLGIPPDPGGGQTGYLATRGEAINESGQVAGSAILATSTNCNHEAARFTDPPGPPLNGGWEIFSICGSGNSAWDMNNLGDLVMRLNVAPYVHFEGIGTFLIEDLIIADVGHWFVINGFGLTINDSRQMAVPATNIVTNEGGIILLTPIGIAGDFDGDGQVNALDLAQLLASWGECDGDPCDTDLDGDESVSASDLAMLLAAWTG